jgi:hypothetical protein
MEVSNNGTRPQPIGQQVGDTPHGKKIKKGGKLINLKNLSLVLLVSIAVLVVAVILFVVLDTNSESSYVTKSDYQAVFVNVTGSSGGQAYFGHIVQLNSKYIELTGVFYLEPGSTNNQFTLNNLSCALYNPQDTMIINRDQVAFWENLKTNSQVTTDINKWHTDNLQCSSSDASAAGSTTGSTGSTSTTGTTDDTTTK